MEKIIEISSLEDCISKIKTIKNGHTFDFYYRGQNSKEYRLLPAIIRKNHIMLVKVHYLTNFYRRHPIYL